MTNKLETSTSSKTRLKCLKICGSEAYSELNQESKMDVFAKPANG